MHTLKYTTTHVHFLGFASWPNFQIRLLSISTQIYRCVGYMQAIAFGLRLISKGKRFTRFVIVWFKKYLTIIVHALIQACGSNRPSKYHTTCHRCTNVYGAWRQKSCTITAVTCGVLSMLWVALTLESSENGLKIFSLINDAGLLMLCSVRAWLNLSSLYIFSFKLLHHKLYGVRKLQWCWCPSQDRTSQGCQAGRISRIDIAYRCMLWSYLSKVLRWHRYSTYICLEALPGWPAEFFRYGWILYNLFLSSHSSAGSEGGMWLW